MQITRLAPSPTGALHLGNARTFLVNWLLARQNGWRIILRIEDIDGPRIKRGADRMAIDDLRWLGIDWDDGPIYQSARGARYAEAIDRLIDAGWTFPCTCSRRDIEQAASAPHASDGAAVYPGACRPAGRPPQPREGRTPSTDSAGRAALRFWVPDETIAFDDDFAGPQRFDVARRLGDFVIRKNDGTPAYQLAVVVDDAEMGVTHIVRGDDLLDSTPRQILLYRALGWAERIPRYIHLPLVVGPDGLRLAKRHGDTRLAQYRQRGVPAGRVLALLARWSGLGEVGPVERAADLLRHFDLAKLPRTPVICTAADDAWLCA